MDLAGELGLPKGTVHGILRTLHEVGFVEQDAETGKYQLGAALLHMGSSYLDGNELRTRALNWSDALASRSSESVRIGTLHEGQVLVVHHVFRPDDSRQALEVGALLPAHATAMGKVLLAHNRYAADEATENGLPASRRPRSPRPRRSRAELGERARARLGRPRSGSSSTARRRSPPRSTTAAASRWARWGSPGRWSGCARRGAARRARVVRP